MIDSLTLTFSGLVTFDSGAFQLVKQGGGTEGVLVSTSVVNGDTVAVLTFTGSDIIGGSLGDGRYTLTLVASKVHDQYGQALDGDRDGQVGGNY